MLVISLAVIALAVLLPRWLGSRETGFDVLTGSEG